MWCVLGNHGLEWKSKLFSRVKNVKEWRNSVLGPPSSTSNFSDPIWARDFGFGLFDSLQSVLDDFTPPIGI